MSQNFQNFRVSVRWHFSSTCSVNLHWNWKICPQQPKNEPPHGKTNKMACAPSVDSAQPWHPPVWSVSAVCMTKALVLSYLLSAQRWLWSDSAQPRLTGVFAGRTVILLVLSWSGSNLSLKWALTVIQLSWMKTVVFLCPNYEYMYCFTDFRIC